MPYRQRPHIADASAAAYRSTACRIGTHSACAESSPVSPPIDLPVVYEACDCPCHSTLAQSAPSEVKR